MKDLAVILGFPSLRHIGLHVSLIQPDHFPKDNTVNWDQIKSDRFCLCPVLRGTDCLLTCQVPQQSVVQQYVPSSTDQETFIRSDSRALS